MTVSDTEDDAAPMIAPTPVDSSDVTDWVAMLVLVSPESFWVAVTLMPAFALAMSETARFTPVISGGPSTARVPVCGRIVPIFRSRGPAELELSLGELEQ